MPLPDKMNRGVAGRYDFIPGTTADDHPETEVYQGKDYIPGKKEIQAAMLPPAVTPVVPPKVQSGYVPPPRV